MTMNDRVFCQHKAEKILKIKKETKLSSKAFTRLLADELEHSYNRGRRDLQAELKDLLNIRVYGGDDE